MKGAKKKFVIIDTMALAYKGYYAFITRPLTNSKGEPTSAVFGFVNQLFKIIFLSGTRDMRITNRHARRCRKI